MNEQEIFDTYSRFIHPIVRATGPDSGEFVGSGFLLKSDETIKLITAAHVLDHHDGEFSPLFIPTENGTVRIKGACYSSVVADGSTRKADKIDIAVITLDQDICERLCGVSCLTPEMLDVTNIHDSALPYFVMGYPVKKSNTSIDKEIKVLEPELYGFLTVEADCEAYEKMSVVRDSHLALSFDKKKVFSSSGVQRTAPDLNGLSGSPVWGLVRKSETEVKAMVVAILIEHHQRAIKAVLGTRLSGIPKAIF
ncbi:MAG: serine protease [Methylobacter sp.]|uniref:hypothetical protein n=1 Tax=Methylobacter sp. TaxID=2051955 RepID=UPI00258F3D1E|nr:hypothetical protein [Methylobacter sp.]MCL7421788.1 serine protease [Methylobacter sp.]